MIKVRRQTGYLSIVFGLFAIYIKALQENPGADRKETLHNIKKKTKVHCPSKERNKSNSEDILSNNDLMMKRIIQQTKELINLIDEEVKSRQKFYETHEERWQDSEKGREYQGETEILRELLNPLNDAICGLKNK